MFSTLSKGNVLYGLDRTDKIKWFTASVENVTPTIGNHNPNMFGQMPELRLDIVCNINGEKKKTSEGIQKIFSATTNLRKWKENMVSYMQSAMSYTNCYYIDEFNPENVDCIVISNQTKESINK